MHLTFLDNYNYFRKISSFFLINFCTLWVFVIVHFIVIINLKNLFAIWFKLKDTIFKIEFYLVLQTYLPR